MKYYPVLLIMLCIPIASSSQTSSLDISGTLLFTDRAYGSFRSALAEEAVVNGSLGIHLNTRLADNLHLRAGARLALYGTKNEQKDLRWPSEVDSNFNFTPDPTLPHELISVDRHMFVEFPLLLRYEFNHKRVSPYLEGGLAPGVYITSKYKRSSDLDPDGTTTTIDNSEYEKVQLAANIALGINFDINQSFQLFAQPSFRYYVTSIYGKEFTERFYGVGLELGLRKDLGKT